MKFTAFVGAALLSYFIVFGQPGPFMLLIGFVALLIAFARQTWSY